MNISVRTYGGVLMVTSRIGCMTAGPHNQSVNTWALGSQPWDANGNTGKKGQEWGGGEGVCENSVITARESQ